MLIKPVKTRAVRLVRDQARRGDQAGGDDAREGRDRADPHAAPAAEAAAAGDRLDAEDRRRATAPAARSPTRAASSPRRIPARRSRRRTRRPPRRVALADALVELQELTERLRRECPWDREQTERTIVPHTVEEAYEVADAALAGDDAKLLDELGDLLFQRTSWRCSSPSAAQGDLEAVARHVTAKLVARHPHVFGDVEAGDGRARARELGAAEGRAGGRGRACSTTCPETLPGAPARAEGAAARRRRSGSTTPTSRARSPTSTTSCASCGPSCPAEPVGEGEPPRRVAEELGDVLFATVNVARRLNVDPELELRAAAERFRGACRGRRAARRGGRRGLARARPGRAGPVLRPARRRQC